MSVEIKIPTKNGLTLYTKDKYVKDDIIVMIDESLQPKGKVEIITTDEVDVTQYETAQVVDDNLKPENIVEGITILGLTGSFKGGGGADTSDATATNDDLLLGKTAYAKGQKLVGTIEDYDYSTNDKIRTDFDAYLEGELYEVYNNRVTKIAANRFDKHAELISVDFPNVIEIGASSFAECANLELINFPKLEKIGGSAFESCNKLSSKLIFENVVSLGASFLSTNKAVEYISFPRMTTLAGRALNGANGLKTIYLPNIEVIEDYGFYHTHVLTSIIMDNPNKVCELKSAANSFKYAYHYLGEVNATYNPEGLKDGYIYVPDNLLEDYKVATNWSVFADRFKSLSELEVE